MNEERLIELMKATFPTKGEMNRRFDDIDEKLDGIDESIKELKASAKAVDTILEAHPIERITRLETHAHLPKYVHVGEGE